VRREGGLPQAKVDLGLKRQPRLPGAVAEREQLAQALRGGAPFGVVVVGVGGQEPIETTLETVPGLIELDGLILRGHSLPQCVERFRQSYLGPDLLGKEVPYRARGGGAGKGDVAPCSLAQHRNHAQKAVGLHPPEAVG
jgi:hypothetical protein